MSRNHFPKAPVSDANFGTQCNELHLHPVGNGPRDVNEWHGMGFMAVNAYFGCKCLCRIVFRGEKQGDITQLLCPNNGVDL